MDNKEDAVSSPTRSTQAAPATGARFRVLLVDDHIILREGVGGMIGCEADFDVVGQAGTMRAAGDLVESLRPDLVVTDLSMPDTSGVKVVAELRRRDPQARIVVLSAHLGEEYVRAAINAGANGYISKSASRTELVNGLRRVGGGERFLCQRSADKLLHHVLGGQQPGAGQVPALTARERQILTLVAEGASNRRMAEILNRSIKTVEKHRASLMRKLALKNAAEVTRFALENNLLTEKPRHDP